jgi:hypothetical protein
MQSNGCESMDRALKYVITFIINYRTSMSSEENILSRDWVTIDEVWIGNRIYWTTNNYDSPTELYSPKIIVTAAHKILTQSSLAVAW